MSAPVRIHEAYGLNSQKRQLFGWDDFLSDQIDDRWAIEVGAGGSVGVVDGVIGGACRLDTGGLLNGYGLLDMGGYHIFTTGKNVSIEVRSSIDSLTNINAQLLRLLNGNNIILMRFQESVDTNIQLFTQLAGVATQIDSGVAPDTDYHIYRVECSSSSVKFYIDDVLVGTSTTNIPTVAMEINILCQNNVLAGQKVMDIDYIAWRQDR